MRRLFHARKVFVVCLVGFLSGGVPAVAQSLRRGPYLQLGSTSTVSVRWRTNSRTDSVVRYGTGAGNLNKTKSVGGSRTEHEVRLTGLSSNRKYYYSVGSSSTRLASGSNFFFRTAPLSDDDEPMRVWVIGDSGTANSNARRVRNGFLAYNGSSYVDVWLMLGDNAYVDGTDAEYQAAVFDTYSSILRQSILWPTLGNHDGSTASSTSQTGPYYDIFTLPRRAEAGGVASGTEAYYSFDYGNVHFVCLNSYDVDRSPNGPMLRWLENDLSQNTKDWLIAYWHHPPYSKGVHDSDREIFLIDMRENANPILEAHGVDMVLCGHSHSYERSYLIDGHYGRSGSFRNSMIAMPGSGNATSDGPYTKSAPGAVSNEGAVYAVAGASGKTTGGPLNHPAMYISLNLLGSMVLDVSGERLDAVYLDQGGRVVDEFSIIKGGRGNGAPTVSITRPQHGATIFVPADVVIEATARDSDGAVTRVDFFADGNRLSTDRSAPYRTTWRNVPSGDHTLTTIATDDRGATRSSAPVVISVRADDAVTVSLRNGSGAYNGMTDTKIMRDTPAINFGSTSRLEIDGSPDSAAIFRWDVTSIPPGSRVLDASLSVRVFGLSGEVYEFYALKRNAVESQATWERASRGNNWQKPGAAGANDRESTVLGSIAGSSTGSTVIDLNSSGLAKVQDWVDHPARNYGLILLDYANADGLDLRSGEYGTVAHRPQLTITYEPAGGEPSNQSPTVSITSPTDGAVYTEPASLVIHASAADRDGNVTRVRFYADGKLLGSDTSSPYRFTWSSPGPGLRRLSAVATDSDGAVATSSTVRVDVKAAGGETLTVSLREGGDGYKGVTDTFINKERAGKNYGASGQLEVDGKPDKAILVRWDLDELPDGASVTDVLLTFQVINSSGNSYELYALKRGWTESQATWSRASAGVSWQTPGADGPEDRDQTVLSSVTWNSLGLRTLRLNAAGVTKVQEWIDRPFKNHGFILMDQAASNGLDFRSSNHGTASQRPELTITYRP